MLHWVACEASSGLIMADLVDLSLSSSLKSTLGRYDTATVSLPIPTAPDEWEFATLPGYTQLICLDTDANGNDVPLWGGYVTQRQRKLDTSGAYTADLSLVTAEGYLDRRYVGDVTYSNKDQNQLVADLVAAYVAPSGIPITSVVTASAQPGRDRTYRDLDDTTVYAALTALMGVLNGPEWTIRWEFADSTHIRPVLYVADRVGAAPPTGLGPNAVFYMPGSVLSAQWVEDYSAGKGANDVMAASSSQNDVRPQSPHQYGPDDGRPRYEFRWSPSSSITDVNTLTAHAQRALAVLQNGSGALTLTAQIRDGQGNPVAPRLGIDWVLGDDVGYDLTHPAVPLGLAGNGRAIGWEIDQTGQQVSPILAAAEVETQQ